MRLHDIAVRAQKGLDSNPAIFSAVLLFVISIAFMAIGTWLFLPPKLGLYSATGWMAAMLLFFFLLVMFSAVLTFTWSLNYNFLSHLADEIVGRKRPNQAPFHIYWNYALSGVVSIIIGIFIVILYDIIFRPVWFVLSLPFRAVKSLRASR